MKPWEKINYTKAIRNWGWKKNLIRGIQIFNWRVKLNLKIALIKGKINQKNGGQTKKNKTKTLIEWWNWKPKTTSTKVLRKQ
jgi:hypothetical protein